MQQQYPALSDVQFGLVNTPSANSDGNMLESWPQGEPGAPDYPRPAGLPINEFGVQVFDQGTTPRDLAADIVSHYLVNTDPHLSPDYQAFVDSFNTPEGQDRLRQDYSWARQNAGERRPMREWAVTDRIPAYFRGYVFDQWPGSGKSFSPEQLAALDRMKAYVHGPRKK
jgi:hypothetical protein